MNAVKELIENNDLKVNLINARFIKPMDYEILNELYNDSQSLIIYETNLINGSLGSLISHYYSQKHLPMTIDFIGIDDHYTPQGTIQELLKHEKMSIDDVLNLVKEKLDEKGKS